MYIESERERCLYVQIERERERESSIVLHAHSLTRSIHTYSHTRVCVHKYIQTDIFLVPFVVYDGVKSSNLKKKTFVVHGGVKSSMSCSVCTEMS